MHNAKSASKWRPIFSNENSTFPNFINLIDFTNNIIDLINKNCEFHTHLLVNSSVSKPWKRAIELTIELT